MKAFMEMEQSFTFQSTLFVQHHLDNDFLHSPVVGTWGRLGCCRWPGMQYGSYYALTESLEHLIYQLIDVDSFSKAHPEAFGDSRMFRGGVARVGAGGNVRLLTPVPSKTEAPPSWPLVAEIF